MKKLFFIIITIAVCTTLYSQQINQLNNRYRSYDVLENMITGTVPLIIFSAKALVK